MSNKIKSVKLKEEFQYRPELIVTLPFEGDRRTVNLKGDDKEINTPEKPGKPAGKRTVKGATQEELKRLAEMEEWKYLFDIEYEPGAASTKTPATGGTTTTANS